MIDILFCGLHKCKWDRTVKKENILKSCKIDLSVKKHFFKQLHDFIVDKKNQDTFNEWIIFFFSAEFFKTTCCQSGINWFANKSADKKSRL